jgi:hypothetical protein
MAEAHLPHARTVPDSGGGVHHEESDVNIRAVFGFAIGLTAATIVISLLVLALFKFYGARASRQPSPAYPLAVQQQNRLPPEPRLQTNPRQDLIDFREQEDTILRSYGWVDKNAGVVRIPIEEAMKAIVKTGVPTRPEVNR